MSLIALRRLMCVFSLTTAALVCLDRNEFASLDKAHQSKLWGGQCEKPTPMPCSMCAPIPTNMHATCTLESGVNVTCENAGCTLAMMGMTPACPCNAVYQLLSNSIDRPAPCNQGSPIDIHCYVELTQSTRTVECAKRRECKQPPLQNCFLGKCIDNGAVGNILCFHAYGDELCPQQGGA